MPTTAWFHRKILDIKIKSRWQIIHKQTNKLTIKYRSLRWKVKRRTVELRIVKDFGICCLKFCVNSCNLFKIKEIVFVSPRSKITLPSVATIWCCTKKSLNKIRSWNVTAEHQKTDCVWLSSPCRYTSEGLSHRMAQLWGGDSPRKPVTEEDTGIQPLPLVSLRIRRAAVCSVTWYSTLPEVQGNRVP